MTRTAAPPPQFSHELYLTAKAYLQHTRKPTDTDDELELMARIWAYMAPGGNGQRRLARACRCRIARVAALLPRIHEMAQAIADNFYLGGHADD